MYKQALALNNLQWLICHKTQTDKFDSICSIFLSLKMQISLSLIFRHLIVVSLLVINVELI